jgi:ferredoxin
MKIAVDAARCQGHALCLVNAREMFDVDDLERYAVVLVEGVPPGSEEWPAAS